MSNTKNQHPSSSKIEVGERNIISNGQIYEIANELESVLNEDDGKDVTLNGLGVGSQYPRQVSVEFPREASMIFGTAGVEISFRDLLSWLAASEPQHQKLITAIREDFYADDEEDYVEPQILPDTWGPFTPEQRAEARMGWSQHRGERLARRMRIEADIEAERAEEAAKWKPFDVERAALDDVSRLLDEREAELDAEWDEFMAERAAWGSNMAAQEVRRRAELGVKADELIADSNALSERWYELQARAYEHFENAQRE